MYQKKKFQHGYYFKKLLQAQKEKTFFTYKGRLFLPVKIIYFFIKNINLSYKLKCINFFYTIK